MFLCCSPASGDPESSLSFLIELTFTIRSSGACFCVLVASFDKSNQAALVPITITQQFDISPLNSLSCCTQTPGPRVTPQCQSYRSTGGPGASLRDRSMTSHCVGPGDTEDAEHCHLLTPPQHHERACTSQEGGGGGGGRRNSI
ncbi:unnamed protein product [Pleuronectes platessa]|uniref:Uncharacterized protein n=1 Tax=Pleuronectes platessa TaxID=8262 RepID=A0A9N7YS00_PLEPL|nr:unnamed protein product [Pleuronectes platessa]